MPENAEYYCSVCQRTITPYSFYKAHLNICESSIRPHGEDTGSIIGFNLVGGNIMDGWKYVGNGWWVKDTDFTTKRFPPAINSHDPILRELVEETIAKSHREWRSIPETAVLVLKAIEDYGVGK